MSGVMNLNEIYNDIIQKANQVVKKAQAFADKEVKSAMKQADAEFGAIQQARIRDIFTDAVREFYGSYSPLYYSRRNSLYDLLDLQTNGDGMVISGLVEANNAADYRGLFDDTMPVDRKGGSLFETVFVEGWHGGAKGIRNSSIPLWGEHPSPGTPYYRRGGIIKTKNGGRRYFKYAKWGRMAVKTESAYQIASNNLLAAEKGELFHLFKTIGDKYNESAVRKINDKIDILYREIIG